MGILIGTTTTYQSRPESNGNEKSTLHFPDFKYHQI